MKKKKDLRVLFPEELKQEMETLGQPGYRAKQIFHWVQVKKVEDISEMSNLPTGLLQSLTENFTLTPLKMKKKLVSSIDDTVKYLYELEDGHMVEAVFMRYHHGNSLCISTQVGCKMGCTFCASTIAGFARNLTAGEMLSQIYATEADSQSKISNVVLMGIGEPLDNYEEVLRFFRLLSHPEGRNQSLRNVTMSTCGIVPGIEALAKEKLGLTLAVSLHAPNDQIRQQTMPVDKRWPIDTLLTACKAYSRETGRRVTYEYALIQGVNDDKISAQKLANKLKGSLCHVNLIPVNPVEERDYRGSDRAVAEQFSQILEKTGIPVTIRRTLGADINAACGQLRRDEMKKDAEK